ncbi:hypothetical protein KM043_001335 [Ampulex compressa]|nr:hypothetical protein KM043_001335 [Ampulex compressa]
MAVNASEMREPRRYRENLTYKSTTSYLVFDILGSESSLRARRTTFVPASVSTRSRRLDPSVLLEERKRSIAIRRTERVLGSPSEPMFLQSRERKVECEERRRKDPKERPVPLGVERAHRESGTRHGRQMMVKRRANDRENRCLLKSIKL